MYYLKPYQPPITKEAFAAAATRPVSVRPRLPQSMSAYKALSEERRQALNAERLEFINRMPFLETPDVRRIREGLTKRRRLNAGHSGASTALAITGRPGLGKTQGTLRILYEAYHDAHLPGNSWAEPGYEHIPVIYVCLSGATTPKQLKAGILNYMGRPVASSEREAQLDSAMSTLLYGCGTQILCLDEVHHLGSNSTGRDVANAIKVLTETTATTFVYIGVNLEDSALLRAGSETTRQLRTRTESITIEPFSIGKPADEVILEGVIAEFEVDLPLLRHKPGTLADNHTHYLWQRSEGRFRSLSELLRLAAIEAIDTGAERITKAQLDRLTVDLEAEEADRAAASK